MTERDGKERHSAGPVRGLGQCEAGLRRWTRLSREKKLGRRPQRGEGRAVGPLGQIERSEERLFFFNAI